MNFNLFGKVKLGSIQKDLFNKVSKFNFISLFIKLLLTRRYKIVYSKTININKNQNKNTKN